MPFLGRNGCGSCARKWERTNAGRTPSWGKKKEDGKRYHSPPRHSSCGGHWLAVALPPLLPPLAPSASPVLEASCVFDYSVVWCCIVNVRVRLISCMRVVDQSISRLNGRIDNHTNEHDKPH